MFHGDMLGRRKFLELGTMTLAGLAAGAAIPRYSEAEQIRYPLKSVSDEGTVLDESKAAKARRVAEYVITKDKHPGLISYNANVDPPQENYQRVQAVMVVDGKRYAVFVINANEDAIAMPRDTMHISVRPQGTTRQEELTTFSDEGLDGICNFGIIPAKISGIDKEIYFNSGVYSSKKPQGLEHKDRFQALYDKTLDTLIKFYEKKK